MITLSAKFREKTGKKSKNSREKGLVPAVLYGPKIKSQSVEVDLKDFQKVYDKAGESSLISLKVEDKEFLVLINETQKDPVSSEIIHIDFYQPILTEEVEATVPLVFEGEAPAVRELGGTLVKEVQEIEVKALPQDLPHEIKVNVNKLKTFEDEILVKDLEAGEKVKFLKESKDAVARVVPPEKVEEELEKPIEEKVEDVEKVEEKEEEEKREEEPKEGKGEEVNNKSPQ